MLELKSERLYQNSLNIGLLVTSLWCHSWFFLFCPFAKGQYFMLRLWHKQQRSCCKDNCASWIEMSNHHIKSASDLANVAIMSWKLYYYATFLSLIKGLVLMSITTIKQFGIMWYRFMSCLILCFVIGKTVCRMNHSLP